MMYWRNTFLKFIIIVILVFLLGVFVGAINVTNLRDTVLGFLGTILFSLLVLHVGTAAKRSIMRLLTNIPQDPNDIIKYILLDHHFIADLSKIIEEEGGIYIFLKKVTPKSRPALHTDDTNDNLIFQVGYKGKYWLENVSSKETPTIIDKIIAAPSVTAYLEKYKMSEWRSYLGNHIFLFITDSQFQRKYADMLLRAGLNVELARREMTLEEKNIFWDVNQN
jgi:hypothetical protein